MVDNRNCDCVGYGFLCGNCQDRLGYNYAYTATEAKRNYEEALDVVNHLPDKWVNVTISMVPILNPETPFINHDYQEQYDEAVRANNAKQV